MKVSNFWTRAFFGTLYVVFLLAGILTNYIVYTIVFGLITVVALHEFYTMLEKNSEVKISKQLNVVGGLVLFLASVYFSKTSVTLGFAAFFFYLLALLVSELFLKRKNPIQSIAYSLFGIVYIGMPLALSTKLVYPDYEFRHEYFLALFVFIWLNDTFAYITGMLFGKHRMFERISPKKSWEGFVGGLFFTVLSSFIFYYFFPDTSVYIWMSLAVVVVFTGTLGDLFESLLKRTLGMKDSGNVIPGHGGILDRIDSTLFAIPAVAAFLMIISYFF